MQISNATVFARTCPKIDSNTAFFRAAFEYLAAIRYVDHAFPYIQQPWVKDAPFPRRNVSRTTNARVSGLLYPVASIAVDESRAVRNGDSAASMMCVFVPFSVLVMVTKWVTLKAQSIRGKPPCL